MAMTTEQHDQLVDRLAHVFWDAHRPLMLKACDDLVVALSDKSKFENDEKLKEAIRVGIRAVLQDLKRGI